MHLYLLRKKDETEKVYKQYEAWVDTQMGAKIKVLSSDRRGEYQGDDFIAYLKSKQYFTLPPLVWWDSGGIRWDSGGVQWQARGGWVLGLIRAKVRSRTEVRT